MCAQEGEEGRAASGSVGGDGRGVDADCRVPSGCVSANAVPLDVATGFSRRVRGLLLAKPTGRALLLLPCSDVHTVGMRHRLDIAFVDAEGVVMRSCRDVGPFRRLRERGAAAVIERFSSCAEPWFVEGDRIGLERMKGEGS
ncbi:DUF192 domain-containing protein [Paraeggerthella hongkongensis]|uniref:ATP-binding protein n=1 Tax=Paraeggerthella hongkongensis TaxID=230658 RepID=A0A3N0BKN9_9ACTN|nr:DUF192 domain-containing protein [Paraeggerthella hongkongensis]RNL48999.1 ATP-binding protein [Paraeggerthella hongkongensis]